MRGKDHLFYLIKSLSKSEKRYFTLDAQKSGRKNSRYLALFQAINQQEEYSELPLKREFGKKLADDKARLYEAILRAMRDYQSKKSYKTRIKELLTDAKILFERKLLEQAENRLEEAKSLALELDDHLSVLEINLRQRDLIKRYLDKNYSERIKELIVEKEKHIQLLQQEMWLHDSYDLLSIDVLRYPQRLAEEEINKITSDYQQVLALDAQEIDSFHAKWRLHRFLALYFRLKGEENNVYDQFQETINTWRNQEKLISENFALYVGDFSNLLSATFRKPELLNTLPQLLEELKAHEAPNYQGKTILFERISIYELIYLLNTPAESIDQPLEDLAKGLKAYEISPSSRLNVHFNAILLLFLNDRFDECLNWLSRLRPLLKKSQDLRRDIHEVSRIIHLLAIYCLGDFELIENTIRSVNRYFARLPKSNLKGFNKLITSTIQYLQKSSSIRQEREILQDLKKKIDELERPILAGLDEITLLWIESQVQDKPIQHLRLESR
ncbi:MAG: hypothetical protein AAFN81_31075 [Bacteroidota bacterium]